MKPASNRTSTKSCSPFGAGNWFGCRALRNAKSPIASWMKPSTCGAHLWLQDMTLPDMNADQLRDYLAFYQDLGFTSIYKRTRSPLPAEQTAAPAFPPVPPP